MAAVQDSYLQQTDPLERGSNIVEINKQVKKLKQSITQLYDSGNLRKASKLTEKLFNLQQLREYGSEINSLRSDLKKMTAAKKRDINEEAKVIHQLKKATDAYIEQRNAITGVTKAQDKQKESLDRQKESLDKVKSGIKDVGVSLFGTFAIGRGFFGMTNQVLELKSATMEYGDSLDKIATPSLFDYKREWRSLGMAMKGAQYGVPLEKLREGVSTLLPLTKQLGMQREELEGYSAQVGGLSRLLRQDMGTSLEHIILMSQRFGKSTNTSRIELAGMVETVNKVNEEFSGTGGIGVTMSDISGLMFDLAKNTKSYVINNDMLSLTLARSAARLTEQGMTAGRANKAIKELGNVLTGEGVKDWKKMEIGETLFKDFTKENFKQKLKDMNLGDATEGLIADADILMRQYGEGTSMFYQKMFERTAASGKAQGAILENVKKTYAEKGAFQVEAGFEGDTLDLIQAAMAADTPEKLAKLLKEKEGKDPTAKVLGGLSKHQGKTIQIMQGIQNSLKLYLPSMAGGIAIMAGKDIFKLSKLISKGGLGNLVRKVIPGAAKNIAGKVVPGAAAKIGAKAVAKGGAEAVAKKAATVAVAKIGAKAVAKAGAKSVGKMGSKLIPGIGLAIAGGFAINKLMKGDVAGAGLEAASGLSQLLHLIPGVGTAGAIATQVALEGVIAVRDTKKAMEKGKSENSKLANAMVKSSTQSVGTSGPSKMAGKFKTRGNQATITITEGVDQLFAQGQYQTLVNT